jgi:hypothetical protein
VPYRSCMHHLGTTCAIWKPFVSYVLQVGGGWCHMGAACAVWELHELSGTCIPMGDRWHHLGAAWDVWGPCESCVHHMGAICTVDGSDMVPSASFIVPSGSHMAQGSNMVHTALNGPHMAHASPIWHHFSSRMLPSGSHTALIKCT